MAWLDIATVLRPTGKSRRSWTMSFVLVLLYVGVMSLALLWFWAWLRSANSVISPYPFKFSAWLEAFGVARIVWSSALVGGLLVVYLWVESLGRDRAIRWTHVGAGALLLALHWAICTGLDAVPRFTLEQIYP